MLLDLKLIRDAVVRWSPYPYFVVAGALFADAAVETSQAFPRIAGPGAVAVEETIFDPRFGRLIDELRSDRFRAVIGQKLQVPLDGLRTVINVRGMTRWTDGNIHTDTPSKLVTVLLYFNQPGQADDTGLRILRGANDLEDFVEEIPPLLGTMIAFKVTPNGWHGHKPFEGVRHSLQLNYLSGVRTFGKHQIVRRLWGRTKRKLLR